MIFDWLFAERYHWSKRGHVACSSQSEYICCCFKPYKNRAEATASQLLAGGKSNTSCKGPLKCLTSLNRLSSKSRFAVIWLKFSFPKMLKINSCCKTIVTDKRFSVKCLKWSPVKNLSAFFQVAPTICQQSFILETKLNTKRQVLTIFTALKSS